MEVSEFSECFLFYFPNELAGGAELGFGTTGFFIGGWLTKRLKLGIDGLFRFAIIVMLVLVLVIVVMMHLGCPQPALIGDPKGYYQIDVLLLVSSMNRIGIY